ncbi:hypothetical protein BN1263310043 [Stenotrophomonas thermophila]|nr:hypothetical protein BN1263310043 [Stenotrophomonas maltophilia]
MGPVAGDAVNPSMEARSRHPWRSRPRNRTHPAFDSSPLLLVHWVRSVFRRKTDLTPETKKSPVDPHRPGIWIATLPRLGEAVPP